MATERAAPWIARDRKARGEPMTREDSDYAIDKALATGLLDSSDGLNFTAKGFTSEEVAAQIIERSTAWGQSVSRDDALRLAPRAPLRPAGFRSFGTTIRQPSSRERALFNQFQSGAKAFNRVENLFCDFYPRWTIATLALCAEGTNCDAARLGHLLFS
jgi:hypothetical protein